MDVTDYTEKYAPVLVGWKKDSLIVRIEIPLGDIGRNKSDVCIGKVILSSGGYTVANASLEPCYLSDEPVDFIQGTPKMVYEAQLKISPSKCIRGDTSIVFKAINGMLSNPVPVAVPLVLPC